MITDLSQIKHLTKKNENENFKFRSFLKSCGLSSKTIDESVKDIAKKFESLFNCKTCANCCIQISPILKNEDINRISKHLKIKTSTFIEKYLIRDEDDDLIFKSSPCPFLKDKLCSIYHYRPSDCKSYPHLHKKNFTSRTIQAINNCSICPIVFKVYEELKIRIRG